MNALFQLLRRHFRKRPDASDLLDVPPPSTDVRQSVRLGLVMLLVGLGGFVVWAALAPLDEGVPAPGVVSVSTKRKVIQHLQGGIVDKILVRDGDKVASGQSLIILDKTQILADLSTIKSNYYLAQAIYDRLQAEQLRMVAIKFNERLIKDAEIDPAIHDIMGAQQQLFSTRVRSLQNQVNILEQTVASSREQVRGLLALEENRNKQISLLERDVDGLRSLVDEGYAPRSRLFELERALAQLNGERATTLADIERSNRAIAEAQLRILQIQQDFLKEVETQLSQSLAELTRWKNELRGKEDDLARATLRAPAPGFVMNLVAHTPGGVVKPGEVLMEVVPENEELVIEAQLPPQLIDKVHPGLIAEVRFASLGTKGQVPILNGKLVTISADRLVDPRGIPYYSSLIRVDKGSLDALKKMNLSIQPGMSADVVVKTGERSMLDYLLRPLLNHLGPALTEH